MATRLKSLISILTDMSEHFAEDADASALGCGKSAPTRLLLLALLAWNAALQPDVGRDAYLDNALLYLPARRDELRRLALRMIEHKNTHHPDDRRLVRTFALSIGEGGVKLRIMHAPPQ